MSHNMSNRKEVLKIVNKIFEDNNARYVTGENSIDNFLHSRENIMGIDQLEITAIEGNPARIAYLINQKIAKYGGHCTLDKHGNLYIKVADEIDDPIKAESAIHEYNVFRSKDTLYYNMDKLDSGECNIIYIVGYSGAGKTTLSEELADRYPNVEICPIDKVVYACVRHKKYDERIIDGFMNTASGRKYYSMGIKSWADPEVVDLAEAYIEYVQSVANKNKDIIFIIEGPQLMQVDFDKYIDGYPVILLGTSILKSYIRKTKRDVLDEFHPRKLKKLFLQIGMYYDMNKHMNKFYDNINEAESTLELPNTEQTIYDLLDNTPHDRIFLTSDWHMFQSRHKKEKNYVNVADIVRWCRANIQPDDIFLYLGDLTFRYCTEEECIKAAKIYNAIPGHKILVLGNHDKMLGNSFYENSGFDHVVEKIEWDGYVFTHKPIPMDTYPDDMLNIHGHIHKWPKYNDCDGKRNINVYPWYFDNKPTTLKYVETHVAELIKDHEWNKNYMLGEAVNIFTTRQSVIQEGRADLPDSAFGIPEDRKFPLDTEQHVRSAIKLFGHAEESKKKSLALNIRKAARKYKMDIPENTQCYKYLKESHYLTEAESNENSIIVDTGYGGMSLLDISEINRWHLSEERNPGEIDSYDVFANIKAAIASQIKDEDFTADSINRYVFVCNSDSADGAKDGKCEAICVGTITIFSENREYEWDVQYPIIYMDGKFSNMVREWAMSSMNPIMATVKPYILKIGRDDNSLISPKKYALSPDIISDKYLVINEDAHLEVVDSSILDECDIEVYEYVGNRERLKKITEAYGRSKIVDNTFFYTALTGKPMLTEDQIDFDPSFRKVDFDMLNEDIITTLVTNRDDFLTSLGMEDLTIPVINEAYEEDIPFFSRYNEISVRKDMDGYYFYNEVTGKRCRSVKIPNMLTENMAITTMR